jgi:SAM-dependent methyltransferase
MRPATYGISLNIVSDRSSTGAPVPCPVCNGPTEIVYRDLFDDRYGHPGLFSLQRCSHCGHRHVPASFTAEDVGHLYTTYYPRKNFDIDSFAAPPEISEFRAWLIGEYGSAFRWVPPGVKVLDIGCGTGEALAYHRSRGCEAVGIEADGNVQVVAARHDLKIVSGVFDGSQFESCSFDYVTLDQVAEHAMEPHALMRGICRVLKPGGTAVVTTPNPDSLGARLYGRHWLNWHIPYHVQFYTRRSMARLAQQAGLVLADARTITPSNWLFFQWWHAATFPRRGHRSAFWCPEQSKGVRHEIDKVVDIVRRFVPVHWGMSQVLDALGTGDNHVFFFRKP